MKGIKKVAIFRALQLGDLMCLIPSARALRAAFPDAEITLIGLPWSKNFVQRYSKYFDRFIEFPGFPGLPEKEMNPEEFTSFLQKTQRKKFDLVLQMQGNGSLVNPMMFLLGARMAAGFYIPTASYYPDEKMFAKYEDEGHESIRLARLVQHLGIPVESYDLEFPITEKEKASAEKIKEENSLRSKEYVIFHGGARDPRRRWGAGEFAKVADLIAGLGYKIVLTGSPEEKEISDQIESEMYCPAVNLSGQTGIGEVGYLIKDSSLLVCNDTGVSHVASALEAPSVVIFSEFSDPKRWAPLNKELHKIIGPDESNVDAVFDAAFDHLKEKIVRPKEFA